jgi:peptidoglycan/LPS O-acetylase OafA/YrhL
MIQRVQSLYLLLAAIFVLAVPFSPGLVTPEGWAWYTPVKVAASLLIAVGCLVAIFLFRDRARQKGLVTVDMALSVALVATLIVAAVTEAGVDLSTVWPIVLPVMALVLLFMARRAIAKDIELIQSMDRLR